MKEVAKKMCGRRARTMLFHAALLATVLTAPAPAEPLSLQAVVTPSTTIVKDGRPVTFALHGFIEFKVSPICSPTSNLKRNAGKPAWTIPASSVWRANCCAAESRAALSP